MDINPSIKLSLNYKNDVIEVEGLNADGKELLKDNGFVWQPSRSSADMYEVDTEYFHKTLNFAILREE
jgi:hypothetical protein